MNLLIWGLGEYAGFVKEHINYVNLQFQKEIYKVTGYIDNDVSVQNSFRDGIRIYAPAELGKDHPPVIIGVYNDESIKKQIEKYIGGEYYTFFEFVYRDLPIERKIESEISGQRENAILQKLYAQTQIMYALQGHTTLEELYHRFDKIEIVAALFCVCAKNLEMARKFQEELKLQCNITDDRKVNTVAFYYFKYANGGVERVISYLIKIFLSNSYQVVLITDEFDSDNEYNFPEGAHRKVISGRRQGNYYEWMIEAANVLKEYQVDLLISHQSYWEGNYYLYMMTKLIGCRFVIEIHNIFSSFALSNIDFYIQLFRQADAVVCLSEVDNKFWHICGINSYYLPNPILTRPMLKRQAETLNKDILWVGRLEQKQKNIFDVLEVAVLVKMRIPDVRFNVVGKFENKKIEDMMMEKILSLGLEENIVFHGYYKDVSYFYETNYLLILTSSYEGFPMSIAEAMSFGLPIVTYDLPYLELFRQGKGFVEVPMRDVEKMADEIVLMLRDPERREQLSTEAIENIKLFMEIDQMKLWEEVFVGCSEKTKPIKKVSNEEYDYIQIVELVLDWMRT